MAHPGVAAAMFEALAAAKINIQMITTSEIKVTCVIHRDDTEEAVRVLHDAFELHLATAPTPPPFENALQEGLEVGLDLSREEREFHQINRGLVLLFHS